MDPNKKTLDTWQHAVDTWRFTRSKSKIHRRMKMQGRCRRCTRYMRRCARYTTMYTQYFGRIYRVTSVPRTFHSASYPVVRLLGMVWHDTVCWLWSITHFPRARLRRSNVDPLPMQRLADMTLTAMDALVKVNTRALREGVFIVYVTQISSFLSKPIQRDKVHYRSL